MANREMKVFSASALEPGEVPQPYPFLLQFKVLGAHGVPSGEVEDHEFTAAADPGAGASFTAANVLRYDSNGNQGVDLSAIVRFLGRVMEEEDHTRLVELLERKDRGLDFEVMGDLYTWLVEEYTARPTKALARSSNGRRSTGPRSMVPLSDTAATS